MTRAQTCTLVVDLPGHAGCVYAVDWAPNGYGSIDYILSILNVI